MPFLRPATVPTSSLRAARARVVTLAVALAAVLAAVAPSPAHAELAQAELAPTPRLVNDALPALALPTTPAPDAATFCPRPTGRWWVDYAVRGCIELLAGRDHTTPITDRELAWLDLGGLPAYATIDPDAIGAAIAAYEQRVAEEEAAREILEVRPLRTPRPQPTPVSRIRRVPTADELDSMLQQCGLDTSYPGYLGEHPCIAALWERIVASTPSAPDTWGDPALTWQSRGLTVAERLIECGLDPAMARTGLDEAAEWCLGITQMEARRPKPTPEQEAADAARAAEREARIAAEREADLQRRIAILEAGIARNWELAAEARSQIAERGATSVRWEFYGWARPDWFGRIAADGRNRDHQELLRYVGEACPSRSWVGYGHIQIFVQPHEPTDLFVDCR